MSALSVLAAALVAWPVVALGQLALELAAGLKPQRPVRATRQPTPRTAVIVPAHNEADAIAATVQLLSRPTIDGWYPLVLVVADNCTDATAQNARAAGATVLERHDPVRRGKGYALAFAQDHLNALPPSEQPEIIAVVDADCRMSAADLAKLAGASAQLEAPVQARNVLANKPGLSPVAQASNFAWLVKNVVRARGLYRLGGGITLFGTGMAFPWALLRNAPLATGEAVEDLQLALHFARAGVRVHLVTAATVESDPAADRDLSGQRSRWEHGFLRMAGRHALPLLAQGLARGSRHLLMLGLHLLVPPLVLLLLLSGVVLLVASGFALAGASAWPAAILATMLALAVMLLTVAWIREGRAILPASALLRAPTYLLWKVPLYLKFFTRRQTGWNRTPRPGERR